MVGIAVVLGVDEHFARDGSIRLVSTHVVTDDDNVAMNRFLQRALHC